MIFINYRGVDADYAPALLFERLSRHFGKQRVFLDNKSIAPGEDYVQSLLEGVRSSKVLLAVIGPQWLTAQDVAGRRLIDNPHDWIRRELVTAFECGVTVIPVFTEGATPPRPEELPADIAQLGRQHGRPLRRVSSGDDIDTIVSDVAKHVPVRRRFVLGVVAAVLLIGAGIAIPSLIPDTPDTPDTSTSSTAGTPETTTTTTAPTTTTTKPPAPVKVWCEANLTLDDEAFTLAYALDACPPARVPAGDVGLICGLGCNANEIAGRTLATWEGSAPPERTDCVALLNKHPGNRRLSVKAGTTFCAGTERDRVAYVEVTGISGPGRMDLKVKVWDLPPR